MNIDKVIRTFQHSASLYTKVNEMPIFLNDGNKISGREIHTIEAIGSEYFTKVTDISRHFGISKSAASQMVVKLEKKGLIKKSTSPTNGKEVLVSLTKAGWDTFDTHLKIHGKQRGMLIRRLSELSNEQLVNFNEVLAIFDEALLMTLNRDK